MESNSRVEYWCLDWCLLFFLYKERACYSMLQFKVFCVLFTTDDLYFSTVPNTVVLFPKLVNIVSLNHAVFMTMCPTSPML